VRKWCDSVGGILTAGRSLIEARNEFAEAGTPFSALIGTKDNPKSTKLPFNFWVVYRLIKVADDPKILQHAGVRPPSWETLHTIAKLPEKTFYEMLATGIIRPDTQRNEIKKYLCLQSVKADEARVLDLQPREGKYRTLVVDPPWKSDTNFLGRSALQYAQMPPLELLAFALLVLSWAEDDCHLYLWTTNADLPLAVECMAMWGFAHKSVITWVKPPPFGIGKYFRGSTEHCLFGILGSIETRSNSIPTHFEAPRGEHSEKPERFYEIVREASYPPYGEAFQRKARPDFVNLYVASSACDSQAPAPAANAKAAE
jgi:N6-adenosine-specific RNA methylase IME4